MLPRFTLQLGIPFLRWHHQCYTPQKALVQILVLQNFLAAKNLFEHRTCQTWQNIQSCKKQIKLNRLKMCFSDNATAITNLACSVFFIVTPHHFADTFPPCLSEYHIRRRYTGVRCYNYGDKLNSKIVLLQKLYVL